MKEYTKNLGKVVMTPKGAWSIEKEYEILDIVHDSVTDHAYISKQEVPSGVDLSDSRYWMPLNVSGYSDSNVITLNSFNKDGEIQSYTLEEAIKTIKGVGRKSGAILIFYNDNVNRLDIAAGCWEIWQFNSINVYDWENLDAWVNVYYNYNKFVGWYAAENVLNKEIPNPDVGCYAFVGNIYNEAFVYRCDIKNQWIKTNQKAQHYIKVVFGSNVVIGSNGNWWQDGIDTNIPVSVKGDNGLTPYLRWSVNNQIEYSYDTINWYILSKRFNTNIRIKDYVNSITNLPNNVELGTVYGVGPIYAENDTEQKNPIYNIYVYTSNGWINNGGFNSISAGVVQEMGTSTSNVMSQAAVTEKLSDLQEKILINSCYGKNSEWVQIFFDKLQDIPYIITLTGNITDATVEGQSAFIQVGVDLNNDKTEYFYGLNKGDEFISGKIIEIPLKYKGNIKRLFVEGRWYTNEKLTVSVIPDVRNEDIKNIITEQASLNDKLKYTHISSLNIWHTDGSINFNNSKRCIEISSTMYSFSPIDGSQIIIPSGDIPYDFSLMFSSLVFLVYDCKLNSVTFSYRYDRKAHELLIASFVLGTETIVSDICWSAIDNISIDGNGKGSLKTLNSLKTEISNTINPIKKALGLTDNVEMHFIPTGVGTIYNGIEGNDTVCLYDKHYYLITDIKNITIESKEGLLFRISEYNKDKKFIKQSEYSIIENYLPDNNTQFIRFSVNYVNFGYSAENPITLDAYNDGDFRIICSRFLAFQEVLGNVPVAQNSKLGNNTSWATFSLPIEIKAGQIFILEISGDITSAATENQTFLAWMTQDTSGKDRYLRIIQGKDSFLYNGKIREVYKADYDITAISIEGRWLNSETLFASIYSGVNAEIEYLENNISSNLPNNIINHNIHKDSLVRSTGIKVIDTDIKPLSFIHMSDTHTKEDNYKCLANACHYLEHYDNISFAIITGDIVWDTYADKMDWYNLALENTTKPVLNVIGNHDSGQNMGDTNLNKVSTDLQCYNKYIAPYVTRWGVVQPTNATNDGKSYYYKDFTEQKIRLIVLCEFETDFEISTEDPTQLKYSREFRAMRQTQVDWLINTLYDTPSDYGVIIALHQPDTLNNEDNAFVSYRLVDRHIANVYADDEEWLLKILDAYQNNKALSFTFNQTGAVVGPININCDFSKVNSELICVLCGHTHDDYIGHYKSYPSINVLVAGANNLQYTGAVCQRKEGTPSEDMFNVVNIDRNRKKISIVRIGADGSAYGQYRNHIVVDY